MYSTRLTTPGIALAVLCAASALTLAAGATASAQGVFALPKSMRAQSQVHTAAAAQEISGVCAAPYRVEFVAPRFGAYLVIADQPVPESHAADRPLPEELVRAELQVPAELLRTLLMEEGSRHAIELRVPAALLATLATEGEVQTSQRSPDLCGPFFSLY